MMNSRERFLKTLKKENVSTPPVWLMRQAGRYHSHYQNLKKKHTFIELCKNSDLACEVTMGPIEEFDFDAAILFSDLLFPLESLGLGLDYRPGPSLSFHLETLADFDHLAFGRNGNPEKVAEKLAHDLEFQTHAVSKIRAKLQNDKALLGFIGGPMTLFYYAAAGSHKGELSGARKGLSDGRFELFCNQMLLALATNLLLQEKGGTDVIVIMDTCAGEIPHEEFMKYVYPQLQKLLKIYRDLGGKSPLMYYSKNTTQVLWDEILKLDFVGQGVDWNVPIHEVLNHLKGRTAIQANFDPNILRGPYAEFSIALDLFLERATQVDATYRKGWICGLGHGVLPQTPEKHVREFVKRVRERL
jgi:uroporphyrinogen decarboxylase